MAADQSQPISGFNFSLSLSSSDNQGARSHDTAFQEVSGLSKELDIEEIASGGENHFKYRLPKANKLSNLVLKRGVCLNNSDLNKWCRDTLDNGMGSPIKTKNIILSLLNRGGVSCREWQFEQAYPVKWSASELNGEQDSIFIETIELAYQYFALVDDQAYA